MKNDIVDTTKAESTETVTKDATQDVKEGSTKSVTEDAPVETPSTHDTNLTTPSPEGDTTVSPQRTVEDSKQHKQQTPQKVQQPDHLQATEDKLPTPKEAWQKPSVDSNTPSDNKELPATTANKETAADKEPEEGGMKVEDMEDERQEIMEYVAVLEEEEQDKEMEDEQQEDEGRYFVLSVGNLVVTCHL